MFRLAQHDRVIRGHAFQQFLSEHADVRQVAIPLHEVEPVTDDKFIVDFEADVIRINVARTLFPLAQQSQTRTLRGLAISSFLRTAASVWPVSRISSKIKTSRSATSGTANCLKMTSPLVCVFPW